MKKNANFRFLSIITIFVLMLFACDSIPFSPSGPSPADQQKTAVAETATAVAFFHTAEARNATLAAGLALTAEADTATAKPPNTPESTNTPEPTVIFISPEQQTATADMATLIATAIFNRPCRQVDPSFKGPVVCTFSAVFHQALYATSYTVVAYDPAANDGVGGTLTLSYTWSNSNPCGKFFGGNNRQASWVHPDSQLPGACPVQAIHPGTITVVISSPGGSVKCEYLNGSASGNIAQCVNQ
jgi:hypothetical protein